MVENIDKLPWKQCTFTGRFNYYARVTDPRLIFISNNTLNKAKDTVTAYLQGNPLPHVTKEEAIRARVIYDSAFHPDTGVKMNVFGRMSSQVPCGTFLVGALLAFYKNMPQLIAMQFLVQSFAANVNYTNRNAKSHITNWQIATAYVGATSGAALASVGLNSLLVGASSLLKRWIPLAAMIVTNSINIPTMRQRELIEGIIVMDKDGNPLGKSRKAAVKGIGQVLLSRMFFLGPAMLIIPTIMETLEKLAFFKRGVLFSACIQGALSGVFSLRFSQLENSLQEEIRKTCDHPVDRVYFNKGL